MIIYLGELLSLYYKSICHRYSVLICNETLSFMGAKVQSFS